MLKKIKVQLSKDIVQRAIYALGLALWTYLIWKSATSYSHSTSSIGLTYLTIYLIPATILTLQIIFNNVLLWGLIFGLLTTYIVIALYAVITDIIERNGNHVKSIDWGVRDISILLLAFGLLLIFDWIIYRIKPKRFI